MPIVPQSKQELVNRVLTKVKEVIAAEEFQDVFEMFAVDRIKLFWVHKPTGKRLTIDLLIYRILCGHVPSTTNAKSWVGDGERCYSNYKKQELESLPRVNDHNPEYA